LGEIEIPRFPMQQIALPSLYAPDPRAVATHPFPLVRPQRQKSGTRARKFLAGVLFGVLMASTLVLLGYEARIYSDQHPEFVPNALQTARQFVR
jgi:hypothetical protein